MAGPSDTAKQATFGLRYDNPNWTAIFNPPSRSGNYKHPRCARGQEEKIRWLKTNLPPSVYAKIASLLSCTKGNNRNYRRRRLELNWVDDTRPALIFTKAHFRCDATIARICLEAP